MGRLSLLIFACLLGLTVYWAWNFFPNVSSKIEDFFTADTFQTLEVRYTAETIMEAHRVELLSDNAHIFLEPTLKFVPYLLMDVKYTRSQDKTGEGVILWGGCDWFGVKQKRVGLRYR